MKKITISKGNQKLGNVPSVSLPACTTCNPDAPCFKQCYAARLCKRRKTVANSYENNLQALKEDFDGYWLQVKAAAITQRFFRYHVSGDIPNIDYFAEMVKTAEELPHTTFLAFTKQYGIVNLYIELFGQLPSNLKIIFSNWGTWKCKNPYKLPTCEVIFKDDTPAPNWKICGGNCTECACRGIGCWELKPGETIAIYKH